MTNFRTIADVVLILGLVIVGGIKLEKDHAYYCPSRKLAMNCNRLSQSTITCYNSELGNKRCSEGWQRLTDLVEAQIPSGVKVKANGGIFSCSVDKDFIDSYTKCIKEDGKEGYLGELI